MGAIAVIYFFGYTLNSLTLLGLLLLIGVVVDDAIVVLENIFRHREELDADPVTAAVNGANEVVFAVIAATLALVSIFAPVIFMSGIIGQFFRSFAVVVTFGVLVSLFVSLTLTPMLCSRFLTVREKGHQHGRFLAAIERGFQRLDAFYRRLLARALAHRWKVVLLTLADRGLQRLLLRQRRQDLRPGPGRRPLPGLPARAARLVDRLHRFAAEDGRGSAAASTRKSSPNSR